MSTKMDIIIFGATGFTGKYTVEHLIDVMDQFNLNLTWGIAGRSTKKMSDILKEIEKRTGKDLSKTPQIVADVNDDKSLEEMAAKCKIVVNCCGPYRFMGEAVVKACIKNGTHHVDVSGEPQFMEKIQLEYNEQAKDKNIYIVSACGLDSIPVDMGALFLIKNFNGTINSIETYLTIESDESVKSTALNIGTWESAVYVLANNRELRDIRRKLFPKRVPEMDPVLENHVIPRKKYNEWVLPFPGTDRMVMIRTQKYMYEKKNKRPIQIRNYLTVKGFLSVLLFALFGAIFLVLTKFNFGRNLLLNYSFKVMSTKMDIIIFGATGFTGKYTVEHLIDVIDQFNLKLTWGIAGRSTKKMSDILEEIGKKTEKDLSKIPQIVADVNDDKSLEEMAAKCKIVVNCCGPYRFMGEAVVKACIKNGTHHVDVSGEPQYMEKIQIEYDEQAKDKNVYIVSACGFESIPTDMGISFLKKNFNGTINSVETYLTGDHNNSVSGSSVNIGTWESAVYTLANTHELRELRKKIFPKRLPEMEPKLEYHMLPRKYLNKWAVPFPGTDRMVLIRTQKYMYEKFNKRPIQVRNYLTVPGIFYVMLLAIFGLVFSVLTKFEFGRSLLLNYPGFFSGGMFGKGEPSEEKIKSSWFKILLHAKGWDTQLPNADDQFTTPPNKEMKAVVSGKNPGYGATCYCLILSAIVILTEKDKLPKEGGVYTPGAIFAETSLIEKLDKVGVTFKLV